MTEASMGEAASAPIVDGVDDTTSPVSVASRTRFLVLVGWIAAIGMALAGLILLAATGWRSIPDSYGFPGFTAPFAFSFGTIGAIIVSRRPGNRVGRLLLVIGILAGFQVLYTAYATYGLLSSTWQSRPARPRAGGSKWRLRVASFDRPRERAWAVARR